MCLKYGITWDCSMVTHRDYTPVCTALCLLYVQNSFLLFLKGFNLKVFLFHIRVFMGPIQVCVHVVRLVDQLIDLPNSALKSEFANPEALQYLCVRCSLLEASPRRWICLEPVLLVFWPLLEICNKVLYQNFYIKLLFWDPCELIKADGLRGNRRAAKLELSVCECRI